MNYMNYVKKFQKCLSSKKNDPKHFLCIFLAIMGIYFLGKIAQSVYNRFAITESFDNSTKKGDPSDASGFLLLHMNGCGYCKKMMPEWDKFVGGNTSKITPKMVERKEDPSLMDKYVQHSKYLHRAFSRSLHLENRALLHLHFDGDFNWSSSLYLAQIILRF